MKTRDVIIGLIVLVVLITGVLVYKNRKTPGPKVTSPTPTYQQVENKFPGLNIPSNADKISLSAPLGGQGMGEAWRTFENGKFSLTVIANLDTPAKGPYQVWVDGDGSKIFLGNLTVEKGGYILNFSSAKDYSAYKKVTVTLGVTTVLEGSF